MSARDELAAMAEDYVGYSGREVSAVIDAVRDEAVADSVTALPSEWGCAHGVSEDEPFCVEAEDEGYECPKIRVHCDDAERFAALVGQVHELDRRLGEVIGERDRMHEVADDLAYAVAPIEVIGEHSSGNDPWQNALNIVTPAAKVDELDSAARRYRVAWRMARTRALSTGGAADRYAARATELQAALQDSVFAFLAAQMERSDLQARITAVRAVHTKHSDNEHCQHDGEPWPCPTLQAAGAGTATYPPALPWAALMDDEDLFDFLGDLWTDVVDVARTAGPEDGRRILAAIEKTCGTWRALAEAQHAHNTSPAPNAEAGEGS